MLVNTQM